MGQGVIAGPTVGPDGNIYVISDYGGLGAFALSPEGQLLWSNPGSPTFSEYGQLGAEIVFGSSRLYAAFDEYAVGSSTMFGLSLGGTQQWASAIGGSDDPFMQQQRQPATGVDGSLYLTAMGGGNGWGLRRVDPASGNVLWNYSPWPSNGMSAPSVGPDGSVYFSRSLGYLESVTPNGQSRWTFFDGSIIDHPAVSPNGSIVVAGDRPNFGEPGSVRGWNASTGALSWQVNLPNENGGYQIAYTQPRFSADSRTAYFGTAILGRRRRVLLPLRGGHRRRVASLSCGQMRGARSRRREARHGAGEDPRRRMLGRTRHARSLAAGRARNRPEPSGRHEAAAGQPGRSDRRAQVVQGSVDSRDGRLISPVPGSTPRRLLGRCGALRPPQPTTRSRTKSAQSRHGAQSAPDFARMSGRSWIRTTDLRLIRAAL